MICKDHIYFAGNTVDLREKTTIFAENTEKNAVKQPILLDILTIKQYFNIGRSFFMKDVPLARQIDFVFQQLEHELIGACAGTVLLQVRNNVVGKFGVKHHPIYLKDNEVHAEQSGLTRDQVQSFRGLAIEALKLKRNWTHGEILYDFSVKSNHKGWSASVLYESNYNMSTWNNATLHERRSLMNYSS